MLLHLTAIAIYWNSISPWVSFGMNHNINSELHYTNTCDIVFGSILENVKYYCLEFYLGSIQ